MLYLLAIFCPPLAVLLCGKPMSAAVNLGLTLLLWVPGVIHAWMVVSEHKANQRTDRLASAIREEGERAARLQAQRPAE